MLRRHLTYANVVSSLTVFLALAGGTAFGATHLAATHKPAKHKVHKPKPKPAPAPVSTVVGQDKVTSASVVDNSLSGKDFADGGGVSGADVADGSLGSNDFADGSPLNGSKLADESVTGADIRDGSLASTKLAKGSVDASTLGPKSVNSAAIADGAIVGDDFADNSVSGRNIKASTLQGVPDAAKLDGRAPFEFLSTARTENNGQMEPGIAAENGTFIRTFSCVTGDVLLGGGPVGVDPNSSVVESFPKGSTWTVRINPHGVTDNFAVQAICAAQNELR